MIKKISFVLKCALVVVWLLYPVSLIHSVNNNNPFQEFSKEWAINGNYLEPIVSIIIYVVFQGFIGLVTLLFLLEPIMRAEYKTLFFEKCN